MRRLFAIVAVVYLSFNFVVDAQEERDPRLDVPGPEYSTRDLTSCQQDVADALVRQSINEYKAKDQPCACPYDFFNDGTRPCGEVSAYIRSNGEEPLCSRDDVAMDTLRQICDGDAGVS